MSDIFGPAVLAGIGAGGKLLAVPEMEPSPPVQKQLSLPRHLSRSVDAIDFAHPTEQELARVFSFYQVNWIYEPTTFHLQTDENGRPVEQVCPDFYLPDHDIYVELTTMRQSLVTKKNRKIRRLKEAFPSLQIKLLYRKDYDRLMSSVFGTNGQAVMPVPGKPLISERQLEQRIRTLAGEISEAHFGCRQQPPRWGRFSSPVSPANSVADLVAHADGKNSNNDLGTGNDLCLIGLGTDSIPFVTALEFELQLAGVAPAVDLLTLSQPVGGQDADRVHIERSPELPFEDQDVLLVAGIVSTGLNASFAADWLRRQGARSVRICTLFDRCEARILDVQISWRGFEAPNEILVGFGIAYQNQYHDLPAVSPLKSPGRPKTRSVLGESVLD